MCWINRVALLCIFITNVMGLFHSHSGLIQRKTHKMYLTMEDVQKSFPYSPFFRNWHCLGIYENMDFSKPYVTNIGDLPLVLWRDGKKTIHTALNVCKHMGTRFDHGKITSSGCLKCPYHGLEYDHTDTIGQTMLYQGRVFWSYNPIQPKPFAIPFYDNPNYVHSFIQIDMPCSLPDAALNTMDLIHPEYVHANVFGFGSNVPPTGIKRFTYPNKNMVGIAFNYASRSIAVGGAKNTDNFNMFHYPNYGWSKVQIPNTDQHLIIGVNFLPLEPKKTRWFVTVVHDYFKSPLQKLIMKGMTASILAQDYVQIRHQYEENPLKRLVMFNFMFKNEPAVLYLKDIFREQFVYPDLKECARLYENFLGL